MSTFCPTTTYDGWIKGFKWTSNPLESCLFLLPQENLGACTHLSSFCLLPHEVQQMLLSTICFLHVYTISIVFLPSVLYLLSSWLNNKNLTPMHCSIHQMRKLRVDHPTPISQKKLLLNEMTWIQTYLRKFPKGSIAHSKYHHKISYLFIFLPFGPLFKYFLLHCIDSLFQLNLPKYFYIHSL